MAMIRKIFGANMSFLLVYGTLNVVFISVTGYLFWEYSAWYGAVTGVLITALYTAGAAHIKEKGWL